MVRILYNLLHRLTVIAAADPPPTMSSLTGLTQALSVPSIWRPRCLRKLPFLTCTCFIFLTFATLTGTAPRSTSLFRNFLIEPASSSFYHHDRQSNVSHENGTGSFCPYSPRLICNSIRRFYIFGKSWLMRIPFPQ